MKVITPFVILLLVCSISFSQFSPYSYLPPEEKMLLDSRDKMVKDNNIKEIKLFEIYEADSILKQVYQFNKKGQLVGEFTYNGSFISPGKTHHYDKKGILKKTLEYYTDTIHITNKTLYKYNNNGQLIKEHYFHVSVNSFKPIYDKDNNIIMYERSIEETPSNSWDYIYNKQGLLCEKTDKSNPDNITGILIKRDKNHNVIEDGFYFKSDTVQYLYDVDQDNQLIGWNLAGYIVRFSYKNNLLSLQTIQSEKTQYIYDDENHIVEISCQDSDPPSITKFIYDKKGLLIKKSKKAKWGSDIGFVYTYW